MAEPTIIIIELVGGVHAGTTLIAEDPSQEIRLDVWDESEYPKPMSRPSISPIYRPPDSR